MRTRIDFIANSIPANLEVAGTDVMIRWNAYAGATNPDMVTGSKGTPTAQTQTIKALLHFIGPTSGVIRQFNEVETGDCMMEYDPAVVLEGRADIRFVIEGIEWSVKPMSQDLKETWDTVFAGRRLFKTLLLKRSTG